MIKREEYFIKLPNNLVWVYEDKEKECKEKPMFKDRNIKTLMVLSYLTFIENHLEQCRFTLESLIVDLGYSPKTGKGKINEQIKNIVIDLEEMGYIYNSNISMKDIKLNTFITCYIDQKIKLNDEGKDIEFFQLYYNVYEKIINATKIDKAILLNVFCYINARMYHKPKDDKSISYGMRIQEGKAETTYFTYKAATKDLGISEQTFNECIDYLKDNNIMLVSNIGYVEKEDKIKIANNVYAFSEEELAMALNDSKVYYKGEGYTVIGKEVELLNHQINGLKSKIEQMKKKNKNTNKLQEKLNNLKFKKDLKGRDKEEVFKDIKDTINKINELSSVEKVIEIKKNFEDENYKFNEVVNDVKKLLELEKYLNKEYRKVLRESKMDKTTS